MKISVKNRGVALAIILSLVMAIFVSGGAVFSQTKSANAAAPTFEQPDVAEHTKPIPFTDSQLICGAPKWNANANGATYTENGGYGSAASGRGTVYSTFGGVYAETFILSAELQAPDANNESTGFFFRAKAEVIPGLPNQDDGTVFNLFNNGAGIFITQTGTAGTGTANTPAGPIAGATATGKEIIKFKVAVDATNAVVTAQVGTGAVTTMTVTKANLQTMPEAGGMNYAGFVTNDVGTTISKISMENKADSAASGYKRFGLYGVESVGLDETEYTNLNSNITEYAGDMVQTSTYLRANSLHGSLSRTITLSKFGKGYGSDFDGEVEVKAPLGTEGKASGYNAGAGMFFRSTQAMEAGKGIYIMLETEKAAVATDPSKLLLKIYAINSGITSGANIGIDVQSAYLANSASYFGKFVKIKFSIANNQIKANAYAEGNDTESILETGKTAGLTAVTTQEVDIKQTSGFYSVNYLPTYKNIVITNKTNGADKDKTFEAYPFNADSLVGTDDEYELYSSNAINYKTGALQEKGVAITSDNKDNGELHLGGETPHDDGGLIGIYNTVFYFRYSAGANKILARKVGTTTEVNAEYEINNGPDFSWAPYADYIDVNRHAYAATIYNEHGYVAGRVEGVIHVLPKKVQVSGVTAVSRPYNTTRAVELSGGTIAGIIDGEEVTLNLGKGSVPSANVGTDYIVTTTIQLAGTDSGNYIIEAQPTNLKVNITMGKMEKPTAPEIEGKTETSITVSEVFGAEYSLGGTTWQDSNVFEGLTGGTEYSVYMRIKGNSNAATSDASEAAKVTTESIAKAGCSSAINSTAATTTIIGIISLIALASFTVLKKKKSNS